MDTAKEVNEFLRNPYWKKIYENAPSDRVKEWYSLTFYRSVTDDTSVNRTKKDIEQEMTKEDLQYLYDNNRGPILKHFAELMKRFI